MNRSWTLEELAELTKTELIGNPKIVIDSFADLFSATNSQASFFYHPKYANALDKTEAGVIFIHPQTKRPEGKNYLLTENPSKTFQSFIDLIATKDKILSGFSGVHPTAVIHPTAQIANDVEIGPYVIIDQYVVVEARTKLHSHVSIGPFSKVGQDCLFYSGVIIRENCLIGNRVILQPGVVIGSCGFGFITNSKKEHEKLNQIGSVIIEDDVEIGANTTIDRARFQTTKIGKGTKIDNLVQIGHGVQIGEHCLIAAQTGIAGSTKIGNHCRFGGQVAINGHIEIDDEVFIAAKSGVSKSLKKGIYSGIPVLPSEKYNRMSVYLRKIETLFDLVKSLAKKNDQK